MSESTHGVTCEDVAEQIERVLDGTASDEILDHIANCDACRDARHDWREAGKVAAAAGDDYEPVADLEKRVFEQLGLNEDGSEADEESDDETESEAETKSISKRSKAGRKKLAKKSASKSRDASDEDEDEARESSVPMLQRWKKRPERLAAAALILVGLLIGYLGLEASDPSPSDRSAAMDESWSGRVLFVSDGAGDQAQLCPESGACRELTRGMSIPAGSRLRTAPGIHLAVEFADGTEAVMNGDTELSLDGGAARRARLMHGVVVMDVAHNEDHRARIEVPGGYVEVIGTKFFLSAEERLASVTVSRGLVRLSDDRGREVLVQPGEEGRMYAGEPPHVATATALARDLSWSEDWREDTAEKDAIAPGLGQLRAKKPGSDDERENAVELSSHRVRVRIVNNIARTEVEEVFKNTTNEVLEGIYRFPLPPDAHIERLALDVDGKLEDGAFVDRERAAKIWRGAIVNAAPKKPIVDDIIWVPGPWKDPALLEWQRGGRFELRIYPIPKQGTRRIVLAYTQVIRPSGAVRRYTYPLPSDPAGSTRVGDFHLDVEVRGHDVEHGVRSIGYDLTPGKSTDGVARLSYQARGFHPTGDLGVEFRLRNSDRELHAWAYRDSGGAASTGTTPAAARPAAHIVSDTTAGQNYMAMVLRPKLPRWRHEDRRAYAIVVDSSRSMIGERYRRATQVAARIVREMDQGDMFAAFACDTQCRELEGGLQHPSERSAGDIERFFGEITPEGGSDVSASVAHAIRSVAGGANQALRVVYIGDGTPTVGAVSPSFIDDEMDELLPSGAGSISAVAVGADADLPALRALARGGVVVPYTPGQSVAEAAYTLLGATYGAALSDIELRLPDGLVEVAPRKLRTIVAGGEALVVARMTGDEISGDVELSGRVGKERFVQRYPLKVRATTGAGNAFVPRLFAAAQIEQLELVGDDSAKQRAIELSKRYNVASKYTSLLVLESPAMFKAFGLDNQRTAPVWTGEEDAEESESAGVYEYEDDEAAFGTGGSSLSDPFAGFSGGSLSGKGSAGLGGMSRTKSAPMSAPKRAAKPKRKMARPQERKFDFSADAPAAAAPAPAPRAESEAPALAQRDTVLPTPTARPMPPPRPIALPRRRMIPMRRVWDRTGTVVFPATLPKIANADALSEATRAYDQNPLSRNALKALYSIRLMRGETEQSATLAEQWTEKDPLDPEAMTARADAAAARGDRDLAIRILGSVVDVRPGDHKAQWRLARLHRWAGRPREGCRFSMAVAQIRSQDAKLIAEAVRCARDTGQSSLASKLLALTDDKTRTSAEALIAQQRDQSGLSGDFRVEARWEGGHDIDLALLHPDGLRVSWLGAPTRSVISATDVLSTSQEGLALRGAKPGQYVVEVVRASPNPGTVRGTLTVTIAKQRRDVPFVLDGKRLSAATVNINMKSRLVPANQIAR